MHPLVHVFPSGLTVVSAALPGFNSAAIGVFIKVGARHEPVALSGISHFLEHMAFKGTPQRTARDISFAVERVGGAINAFTAHDRTGYYIRTLGEHVPIALDILTDVVRNPTFPADELEMERNVIMREIAAIRDLPDEVNGETFLRMAYPDQPLGRPITGHADFVASVGRDQIIAYMRERYVASDMVIVGVGKLDPPTFVRQVEERFGDMPTRPVGQCEPTRYGGGLAVAADDYEETQVMFGFPVCSAIDAAFPATDLLSDVLGGGMSSPFFQEVREKRGLCYRIQANSFHLDDCGLFQISASTSNQHLPAFFTAIFEQLLATCLAISDDDFERAKNQHRAELLMKRERPLALVDEFVSDLFLHQRIVPIEETLAAYDAVTPAEISAVARRMWSSKPTLALLQSTTDMGDLGFLDDFMNHQTEHGHDRESVPIEQFVADAGVDGALPAFYQQHRRQHGREPDEP